MLVNINRKEVVEEIEVVGIMGEGLLSDTRIHHIAGREK